jgi:hypothetical protein
MFACLFDGCDIVHLYPDWESAIRYCDYMNEGCPYRMEDGSPIYQIYWVD